MKRKKHKWEMKELKKKRLAEDEVENMKEPEADDKITGDGEKSVEFEQENMDTNVAHAYKCMIQGKLCTCNSKCCY